MYELCQVAENTYYFASPARVGLYRKGSTVYLLDGGSDESAAKRMLRTIRENGWELAAIFNTHSHADHIGGNRYLQQQTGCRIFAPDAEATFARHPVLEAALLYGGLPPEPLRHKFLLAHPSDTEVLTDAVLPEGLTLFDLSGHCLQMVGFETDDGVCFVADSVCSEQTLQKYGITYLFDVAAHLRVLQALRQKQAKLFVPVHAEPSDDLSPLIDANIAKIFEVGDVLCALCAQSCSTEALIAKVFEHYGLRCSFEQLALVGSTVRSYLTWLSDLGRIRPIAENNLLLWQAV